MITKESKVDSLLNGLDLQHFLREHSVGGTMPAACSTADDPWCGLDTKHSDLLDAHRRTDTPGEL
jgi:hypothetical protein